jgi:beta-lactamase regulating signal transducer with metallopeptidase domain
VNAALILSAIFNGAWQGTLLCLAALLTFRMFRRLNATTMFTVWSVLLAIAVLLPFANYAFAPHPYTVRVAKVALRQVQGDTRARTHTMVRPAMVSPSNHEYATALTGVTLREALTGMVSSTVALGKVVFDYAGAILWLLLGIALVRLAVLGRDVVQMLAARGRVRDIEAPVALNDDIARPYRFAASDEFTSPCVLGFMPALIVIPEELLSEPDSKLTSVVLHEREHVRRFDDIQNVLQRIVGALAFFCPGVRIALRELALYREQICDDAAVNATGDRVSYAMTLTGMAQWAQGRGAPVPSLIFKRKHLLHRLEVLLDSAVSHSMAMNRRFAVGAVTALAIAAVLVLRVQVPVIAETLVTPPAPKVAPAAPPAKPAAAPRAPHKAPKAPKAPVTHTAVHTVVRTVVHTVVHTVSVVKAAPKVAAVAPVAPRTPYETTAQRAAIAPIASVSSGAAMATANAAATAPVAIAATTPAHSGDLLDALSAAGLQNLPVDQLIALRDHGVNGALIRAATSYFGHVGAQDLTYLADHGVGPSYIEVLRSSGVRGIAPASAVLLMDHGVSAPLIHAAVGYFHPAPSAADLAYLADHGFRASCFTALHAAGLDNVSVADAVRLFDHGVSDEFLLKVRRMNPRATIDDIIRLHDAGF